MSERSTQHGTFVIERVYPVSPARVFSAWSRPEIKDQWSSCHDDWEQGKREFDFRVGGRESSSTGPRGGPAHIFEAYYQDIVPNQRIVYSYEMRIDDKRISVSLVTIEFKAERNGTRMVFTEQGVFLDGLASAAEREEGTRVGLGRLDALMQHEHVTG